MSQSRLLHTAPVTVRESERRSGAAPDLAFDWNNLRFFLAVARKSRLTGASQLLGVNHTTVGRRIQVLEEALNTTLFDKTPAGYILNQAGKRLLDLAENIESACVRLSDTIGGQDNLLAGKVRLSVPEDLGSRFLAPALRRLCEHFPQIGLELLTGPHNVSISKREADLAITTSRPLVGRVIARRLSNFKLRLYGSADYLKQRPPIESPEDLRHHAVIEYIGDGANELDQGDFSQMLLDYTVKFRTSSINAIITATTEGLGLCVLPCFVADRDPRLQCVLPGMFELTRTFWISMHEDYRAVRRVMEVRSWIINLVQQEHQLLLGHTAETHEVACEPTPANCH